MTTTKQLSEREQAKLLTSLRGLRKHLLDMRGLIFELTMSDPRTPELPDRVEYYKKMVLWYQNSCEQLTMVAPWHKPMLTFDQAFRLKDGK